MAAMFENLEGMTERGCAAAREIARGEIAERKKAIAAAVRINGDRLLYVFRPSSVDLAAVWGFYRTYILPVERSGVNWTVGLVVGIFVVLVGLALYLNAAAGGGMAACLAMAALYGNDLWFGPGVTLHKFGFTRGFMRRIRTATSNTWAVSEKGVYVPQPDDRQWYGPGCADVALVHYGSIGSVESKTSAWGQTSVTVMAKSGMRVGRFHSMSAEPADRMVATIRARMAAAGTDGSHQAVRSAK